VRRAPAAPAGRAAGPPRWPPRPARGHPRPAHPGRAGARLGADRGLHRPLPLGCLRPQAGPAGHRPRRAGAPAGGPVPRRPGHPGP
ncbi:MAG: Na(+) H(+) antiporter subunit A / Na(+) H(+) antiporter subunit B, partial [uncultured Pseudonocardia sp.]